MISELITISENILISNDDCHNLSNTLDNARNNVVFFVSFFFLLNFSLWYGQGFSPGFKV